MLKRLEISNYAIIEKINIDFSNKLTIITGETGAGKSILMGALGLLLGRRADLKVLFDDSKKCFVEGTFNLEGYDLEEWFDTHEMEFERELIIRREIATSGKSRAFLNDGLVTLAILKSLSIHLIDIFAQFDTLDIQHQEEQFKILDTMANQLKNVQIYQKRHTLWQDDLSKLSKLKQLQSQQLKEEDYIKFQYEEIEQLNLKIGEYHDLEQKLKRLSKSADIQAACHKGGNLLKQHSSSIISQLNEVVNGFRSIKTDLPEIIEFINRLDSGIVELEDLAMDIERFGESDMSSEENLQQIEDRLSLIYSLLRKHQLQNGDQLLELMDQLSTQMKSNENLDSVIKELEAKAVQEKNELLNLASKLNKKRESVKKNLEDKIRELLIQLAMPDAVLSIQLEKLEDLNRFGNNSVEFLFTANLGSKLLPVKQVASGGEMSRLNLCLKSIVAGRSTLPTLIFDEIDSGISGMVAEKMGRMIHQLAQQHQIISITHSPQIAAKANQHYFVFKEGHTGKTQTKVKVLNEEERITEIATMLSTDPPSKSALANAKELLNL